MIQRLVDLFLQLDWHVQVEVVVHLPDVVQVLPHLQAMLNHCQFKILFRTEEDGFICLDVLEADQLFLVIAYFQLC